MKTDFEDLMGRIGMKHHCFEVVVVGIEVVVVEKKGYRK
jgi:hypothetical protein